MEIEIIPLGTGCATPRLERNASGLVVRVEGFTLLVDIGPGTLRRLCEARIDFRTVDAILVTHFHPDHVADLVSFLFASNYAYVPSRTESFHVIGPKGLERFYEVMVEMYGHWVVPSEDRLILKELSVTSPDSIEVGPARIGSTPAKHISTALSYRIEIHGKALAVSGDTEFHDGLVELARDCDTLICECSMPEGMKFPGHMVPSEAGRTAALSGVRRLVLTHLYPPCDEVDIVAQAAKEFSGEIIKGEDLEPLTIGATTDIETGEEVKP